MHLIYNILLILSLSVNFFSLCRTREVVLPRFKLEQNFNLNENLKEMGLNDLFQASADFSGMTDEKVSMNWVSKKN